MPERKGNNMTSEETWKDDFSREYAGLVVEARQREDVENIAEGIRQGWWITENSQHHKVEPVNPPWWWSHAMDGSPAPGATEEENRQIWVASELIVLLNTPVHFDFDLDSRRIAELEKAALSLLDSGEGNRHPEPKV
jgi:hypothetical protein